METVVVQGAQVPALGFGTLQLKGPDARDAVRDALDIGYRHVDTAQKYDNEGEVGGGIADSGVAREEIWLTTKLDLPNLQPSRVGPSTEESLRKLGTDYVDLLLIHWPSPDVPVEATLEAMSAVSDEGKASHIGVCNAPLGLVRRAVEAAPIFGNQVEYHPFLAQDALLSHAREHGYMLTAYCPLARGKVLEDATLAEVGRRHGKTPAQVALRWLLQQPMVAAIPRSSSKERRLENLDVFDFELGSEEMDQITGLDRGERLVDPPHAPDWNT